MEPLRLNQLIDGWLAELAARVARDLTTRELHRGLRALSETYVRRRADVGRGAALRGAGKRAAFALYYAPLHLLTVHAIVEALGATHPAPLELHDLGCGSGAAGAGWALACDRRPGLSGSDLHPWAVEEARRTWRALGLRGRARCGRIESYRPSGTRRAVVLGWTVNELAPAAREALLDTLLEAARRGERWLVVEPIWRRDAGWWDAWAARVTDAGGRADEWRFDFTLPSRLESLGRGAGLEPRRPSARSLWLGAARR